MMRLSHQVSSILKTPLLFKKSFTPLSYSSLSQRSHFSSTNHRSIHMNERIQKITLEKNEHNVSELYSVLTKQGANDYLTTIGKEFGVQYLEEVSEATVRNFGLRQAHGKILESQEVHGKILGHQHRRVVALPVTAAASQKSIMMIFILAPGSPITILSEEAAIACGATHKSMIELVMMGEKMLVHHSSTDKRFVNLNILGNDFFEKIQAKIVQEKQFTVYKQKTVHESLESFVQTSVYTSNHPLYSSEGSISNTEKSEVSIK